MAGRGPRPKAAADRRRANDPARGEWTEIAEPSRKRTPLLPARGKGRGKWSPRTRYAWKAWWSDPASTQWSLADQELVLHLADVYEEWVREPTSSKAAEIRQLRDSLGLTPKGRQDRRWRISTAEVADLDEERKKKRAARPRRLRAVDAQA